MVAKPSPPGHKNAVKPAITEADWSACLVEIGLRHEALACYLIGSTVRIEADRLLITVNSPSAAAWIHHRFRPLIQATVRQVTGLELSVTITV